MLISQPVLIRFGSKFACNISNLIDLHFLGANLYFFEMVISQQNKPYRLPPTVTYYAYPSTINRFQLIRTKGRKSTKLTNK